MQRLVRRGFAGTGESSAAPFTERTEWPAVAVIMTLGLALRLWSPAMNSDFWYDEVFSYNVAGRPFGSMLYLWHLGADTNPPLYTVLLHFWLKLGSSDTHVKLLSLLFATPSPLVLYLLARRIGGRYVGLLACLLMASSPSVITYSVQARPYSLFLLLSLLSTYLLLLNMHNPELRTPRRPAAGTLWVCYSVVSILAVYTHWFALLLLAVQAGALLACYPNFWRTARPYLTSLIVVVSACLPLAPFLRNQIELQNAVGGYCWPGRPDLRSVVNLAAFLAGGENLLVLTIVIAMMLCLSKRNQILSAPSDMMKRHILFLASYLVLPVAAVYTISNLLASNSFFVKRYFLPFIVSVHILTALALSGLDRRIAVAFLLAFVLFPLGKIATRAPETPYSQTALELSLQTRGHDALILHLSPMSYYPLLHYRQSCQATERILCVRETDYNLAGGMLTRDDLIEAGADLEEYKDLWVVIDPMDKENKIGDAYECLRTDHRFVLASEKRFRSLRLEHYTAGVFAETR